MRTWRRAPTPVGWLVLLIAGATAVAVLAGAVGIRWDPLRLDQRRLEAARAEAAAGRASEQARDLERQGQAAQQRRLDTLNTTTTQAARATASAVAQARSADDAQDRLDHDRLRRLRDHDRELCRLASHLGGCASPDPA